MTSRLDRLFLLLENGGSEATRQAAALQLGEVVRLHPHELDTLINRLYSFITSKTWETRIAAGQAVNAIISNIPKWDPNPLTENTNESGKEIVGHLSLGSFNIQRVLENGSYLLGGDERQFELDKENDNIDPREKAARQRLLVNQRLGLDIADALGINTQAIFTNADLNSDTPEYNSVINKGSVVQIVQKEMVSAGLKMSSRELNRAKRKAKYISKQKSSDISDKTSEEGPEKKRLKSFQDESPESDSEEQNGLKIVDEKPQEQDGFWPLDEFAERLSRDLFSCAWEARHGAATALREVIRLQGKGAGKGAHQTFAEMEASHLSWLEDKAVRLVCVLALDRFGDFLADQVVAPVRETSAQALGCIVQYMHKDSILSIVSLLKDMLQWEEWGTRHGGLLGFKYLLAVRCDLRMELLEKTYNLIFRGLKDEMDDVVAVAATCLVPVAEDLVNFIPPDTINDLINTLWEALLDTDDLTASTNSILLLIAKLLSYKRILENFNGDLCELVTRLWAFLYHSNASIRSTTLKTIKTLLENFHDASTEDKFYKLEGNLKEKNSSCKEEPIEEKNSSCKEEPMEEKNSSCEEEPMEEKNSSCKEEHIEEKNSSCKEEPIEEKNSSCKEEPIEDKDECEEKEIKSEAEVKECKNPVKEEGTPERKPNWLEITLEPLLTHTYQRSLLENSRENLEHIIKIWDLVLKKTPLSSLLLVTCRLISTWLCLMMTNSRTPLDANLIVLAFHPKKADIGKESKPQKGLGESASKSENKYYIGGSRDIEEDTEALDKRLVMARCTAASLIGNLSHYISQPMPCVEYQPDQTPILCYVRLIISHLSSRSALQQYGAGLVTREWALQHPQTICHSLLKARLLNCLQETIYYDEIAWMLTRLQQESKDFLTTLKLYNIPVDPAFSSTPFLNLEQVKKLCESSNWLSAKLRKTVAETLESRSKSILKSVAQTSTDQIRLNVTIHSVISGALVRFKCLPEKLNPVIKPLMESIKNETNEQHQRMAALDLTFLIELCIDREPSPNAKILKNLSSFLCVDEEFTPNILSRNAKDLCGGMLSLIKQQKLGFYGYRRSSSLTGRSPGRPPLKSVPSTSNENCENAELSKEEEKQQKQNAIQRRGCTLAIVSIVNHFGPKLGTSLPYFQSMIFDPLINQQPMESSIETKQNTIHWLQLLEIIIPVLHSSYIVKYQSNLQAFDVWLFHSYSGIRHMASRVFAALASVSTNIVVCHLIEHILPNLKMSNPDFHRMGAMECVHLTIEKLGFEIIPYIVLLIVPLLGSMSDVMESLRHLGTQCFATLIRLFPLDGGANLPCGINSNLATQIAKERVFLERLLDPKKIEDYKVPVPINAELRAYQQKGINWLAFLREFNLHGILCDDMGLGKTLQSICILAGDHHDKETQYLKNKGKSDKVPCKTGYQSLVVCPPTLTGHWYYEVTKFVSKKYLSPLHCTGQTNERKRLRNNFWNHNLIIASYKIVRNEVDFFSKIKWNYIVLDEGHVIKNGKTKSSKAIKELVGSHRLILTGTPIQNNVLELWSLFDFLMPGFLGTERQFIAKYSKPIIQSKEAKSSSKEQEAGVIALESLHRQVLPFILRRLKDDVLHDLPPKITQDYFCELSPLQERLYEDFARSRSSSIDNSSTEEKGRNPHSHIFQALQYLRRVCNHPKLVLSPSHPQFEAINREINERKTLLSDISHAAKLPALKQLLLDCGIGSTNEDPSISSSSILSPHRALIFCQLKGMLDIIEKDLLKVHLPSVSYLRLDGSVPAGNRHSLVHKFNSDPSIDLLLLTTQVGGLGLNLTGADTVIFVEHDWNPMRDLQAMDRAHRIGQKRVVNVYRLITKGTLEEKIMSLQKFKLMTANTIISQENSSLLSMGTDQLLELFTLDNKGQQMIDSCQKSRAGDTQTIGLRAPGLKEALECLPELWEAGLYEEEYNLDSFLKTLKQN